MVSPTTIVTIAGQRSWGTPTPKRDPCEYTAAAAPTFTETTRASSCRLRVARTQSGSPSIAATNAVTTTSHFPWSVIESGPRVNTSTAALAQTATAANHKKLRIRSCAS